MATLARHLRKDLEKTVKQARRVAETGARKVLEQLGVHHHEPYGSMTPEQRAIRNRLRAHGRQLGDRRDRQRGTQTINRLIQECAYEHWHRMLFARFLAETDLLIEPQSGVAITLEECQELAREQGADWLTLASDYAERMLPQIFRTDDPVLAVTLPPETRSHLEDLLKALTEDVFTADDSLGWVYQFWQAERKEEVNRSETKIGAYELPTVTQLFTEDYMVLFLLHNTLGAWWAGRVLAKNPDLATFAQSEDEIRSACRVGDVDWRYLRLVRDKSEDGAEGPWRPAAGTFDGWPDSAKDLSVLDPCMGSGHFLVFALPILLAFRKAEEGLSDTDAADAVLQDNLFGLEIDPRCTQIAAFNLAFAAWRRSGFRVLPPMNLACSGLATGVAKGEWLKLAQRAAVAPDRGTKRDLSSADPNPLAHVLEERVKNGLEALHDIFVKAPLMGSLIDPGRAGADIFREGFEKLEPLLTRILEEVDTDETREMAVAAHGLAKAAEILRKKFNLIATNVPYLAKNKQHSFIQDYCARYYPRSNTDLATVFMERELESTTDGGTLAVVSPRIWMTYTAYYSSLRSHLLKTKNFNCIFHLGKNAFETISGEIVDVSLAIITNRFDLKNDICISDISNFNKSNEKASAIPSCPIHSNSQSHYLDTPGMSIVEKPDSASSLLSDFVQCFEGLSRGDTDRFDRKFWELSKFSNDKWVPIINSSSCDEIASGADVVFLWEDGNGTLAQTPSARIQGKPAWGRPAIFVSRTHLHACLTQGFIHAQNGVALVPRQPDDLLPILLFCRSEKYREAVNRLNQKLIKPTGVMDKVPFDQAYWRSVVTKTFPDGKPSLETSDPTQLYFSGEIVAGSEPLQVAVARLVGYQWPRQKGLIQLDEFPQTNEAVNDHAAVDGIVCLPAVHGHPPGADRLENILRAAFKNEWSVAKLQSLLSECGFGTSNLSDWLLNGFFKQHCKLFGQRPFVWHIWDGRRDGFSALVNYHRLVASGGEGRRTLENLTYAYLGDWIDKQRQEQQQGVDGADARVLAAVQLKTRLELIIAGEHPHDLFVRWKPLSQQPVGWEPDVEDGVKVNIRPFLVGQHEAAGSKSILRSTPNIKWKKSSGKELEADKDEYPWLYNWDERTVDWPGGEAFSGERFNACHYSLSKKTAARSGTDQ